MYAFSATQAFTPAIERTKQLLFRPFQFWTFIKLCTVAVLTGGGSSGGGFNGSNGGHHTSTTHSQIVHAMPNFHFNPAWILPAIFALLAVFVLGIWIFYLLIRLRFAFFDCLIHQTKLISPGWRKYRYQAFRYFLLCIVVGLVFFGILAVIALPFILGFVHLYQQSQSSGQFPVAGFLALFLPLLPIILLIVFVSIAVSIILRDFIMPHYALDNASAGQAWAAVRTRIMAEKGSFLLYAVLRLFAPMVVAIGLVIVLIIPAIVVFGGLGVLMAVVYAAIAHGPASVMIVGWSFESLLGLIMFALFLLAIIGIGGPVSIAFRNYGLVFYSGRYQALSDIMFPPPPPPAPLPAPVLA
jgi:hypothetical protein